VVGTEKRPSKAASKAQERESLYQRYGGRCSYCGDRLGKNWQADHVQPVGRQGHWVRVGRRTKWVMTGGMDHPERDCFENLTPACHLCNINKGGHSLESWRAQLQRSASVLTRAYSTYRHAKRFGLVVEAPPKVRFFFEYPRRRILNIT
jgi:5-methylcytosine-specific restriction endonuclease McrA